MGKVKLTGLQEQSPEAEKAITIVGFKNGGVGISEKINLNGKEFLSNEYSIPEILNLIETLKIQLIIEMTTNSIMSTLEDDS